MEPIRARIALEAEDCSVAATSPDEQAIFEVARKHDACAAREAYLQQACGNDTALDRRVRALLKAYEESASFLEVPVSPMACTQDEPLRECPGALIGPYKLLKQIGEGGFGVVFMAEQTQPVRRKVALKVLKPGMDTRQVVARFEAERQALALMDHPNIAKVLDGGQTGAGGNAFGGGLYVAGGVVSISNTTLSGNEAAGGDGGGGYGYLGTNGPGGNASGGAICVAAGQVVVTGVGLNNNIANSPEANASGGGLYIANAATVYLDAFTVANTTGNYFNDISGLYTIQN
jgi:hypothetical protein